MEKVRVEVQGDINTKETGHNVKIVLLRPLPAQLLEHIRDAAPGAAVVLPAPGTDETELRQAEIVFGTPNPAQFAAAVNLRWLQLPTAGADRYVAMLDGLGREIALTTAVGAYGIPIAEHLFAMLLALIRRLPLYLSNQSARRWERAPMQEELYGKTALIIGYGDIGRAFAARARGFGLRLTAIRRRVGPTPPELDILRSPANLEEMLSAADVAVNCLPLTPATRGLLDRARLACLRPGAYFLNVGRGATVDEQALAEMLRDGRLAGAGLDVFAEEPLPAASPLWDLPNVIITPHVAGLTDYNLPRIAAIFAANLRAYREGGSLRNRVDLREGY